MRVLLLNKFRRLNWQRDALIGISAVLLFAFVGPFDTYAQLKFLPRLAFWSAAILGYGILFWAIIIRIIEHKGLSYVPKFARLLAGAFIAAFPGALLISLNKYIFMGQLIISQNLPWLWFTVFTISVGISALHTFTHFGKSLSVTKSDQQDLISLHLDTDPKILKFLDRLPDNLGVSLISMSMQDHYMKVVTKQGSAMLHMKLADAVAELENYPGQRIHRSHWVANSEVHSLKRNGRDSEVLLSDGQTLPVSRVHKANLVSLLDGK